MKLVDVLALIVILIVWGITCLVAAHMLSGLILPYV